MREPRRETNQGFTRAAYISEEALEAILEGVAEGREPLAALCREHGTCARQFNLRCDRDPELERRRAAAYEERKRTEPAELEAEVYRQIRDGNWKALEKMMIVVDPKWRQTFAQSRLELSLPEGQSFFAALLAQIGPRLSDERLGQLIAIVEEVEEGEVLELPQAEER